MCGTSITSAAMFYYFTFETGGKTRAYIESKMRGLKTSEAGLKYRSMFLNVNKGSGTGSN